MPRNGNGGPCFPAKTPPFGGISFDDAARLGALEIVRERHFEPKAKPNLDQALRYCAFSKKTEPSEGPRITIQRRLHCFLAIMICDHGSYDAIRCPSDWTNLLV